MEVKPSSAQHPPSRGEVLLPGALAEGTASVLDVFLRVLIVSSLAVSIVSLFLGPVRTVYLAAFNALVDGLVLWRLRRGRFDDAPFIVAVALWAVVSLSVFWGRGTHDIGMVVLGILMMVAALLRRLWQTGLILGLSLTLVWGLGIAEMTGVYRNPTSHLTGWDDLVVLTIVFAAGAVLMRAVVRRLAQTVRVAEAHERSYEEIFNATNEIILVVDCEQGLVLDANEAAIAALAPSKAALLGQGLSHLLGVSPEVARGWLQACADDKSLSEERQVVPRHGQAFWCDMSLRSATVGGQRRLLVVLRDAEARHRLQEELRQDDKLRSLGQLAGGVAHDFNNQLTGILANAELLKMEGKVGRPLNPAFLDSIIRCATRSSDLTRQLLAFARKARPRRETVDLVGLVQDVAQLLRAGLDPKVSVEVQAPTTPLLTSGDPSLLHNALLNLGLNGREAMPGGGVLSLEVGPTTVEPAEATSLHIEPGEYVRILVRDTGVGMDTSTLRQIFEPFFTTKESGTGMGLAAAYGTARGHGGALTAHSAPGQGSTFCLHLPLAQRGRSATTSGGLPAVAEVSLRLLVVDDEPDVAEATVNMCRALGHRPCAFSKPREALEAFAADPAAFDMVMLDRVMPDCSGDALLEELRRLRPGVPVVMASGYSEGNGLPAGVVFVAKPFGPHELDKALRRAVRRGGAVGARAEATSG